MEPGPVHVQTGQQAGTETAVRGSVLTRFRGKHPGRNQTELPSLSKDNQCLQKSIFKRVK